MGTRNLTIVVQNGEYILAQYGQWDGYPDGQGAVALAFVSGGQENIDKLLAGLKLAYPLTTEKYNEIAAEHGAKKEDDGFSMTFDQSRAIGRSYPSLTRDTGAAILEYIASQTEPFPLKPASFDIGFAGDSLFCEWAYLLDLDKRTFEAYEGFNKTPLMDGDRFKDLSPAEYSGKSYYPVKLAASWSFDALPTREDFIEHLKREPEDDESGD